MKKRFVFFLIFVLLLSLPCTILAMDAENQQSVYVDDPSNGPNGARPATEEHMREYLEQQEVNRKAAPPTGDSRLLIMIEHLWNVLA